MSEPIVLVERHGAVALVTLNRPDALNALNRALRAEIVRVFIEYTGLGPGRVILGNAGDGLEELGPQLVI
mgnify:CR=1 FL=1